MFLYVVFKVLKYGLFYFDCNWTLSVVLFSEIVKVISGDNVSKGSKVMIRYGFDVLEVDIIGVNGMYVCLFLIIGFLFNVFVNLLCLFLYRWLFEIEWFGIGFFEGFGKRLFVFSFGGFRDFRVRVRIRVRVSVIVRIS